MHLTHNTQQFRCPNRFLRRFDRSKPAADNHPQTTHTPDCTTPLSTTATTCTVDPNADEDDDHHQKTPARISDATSVKDATDGDNDDDDDDDDEMSFVTSPLLIQQQQHPSSRPSTSSTAASKTGPLWRPRDAAAADGVGDGDETAAFVAPAKRPTSIYGGARRPWRSRNRRFVYDGGNINSD